MEGASEQGSLPRQPEVEAPPQSDYRRVAVATQAPKVSLLTRHFQPREFTDKKEDDGISQPEGGDIQQNGSAIPPVLLRSESLPEQASSQEYVNGVSQLLTEDKKKIVKAQEVAEENVGNLCTGIESGVVEQGSPPHQSIEALDQEIDRNTFVYVPPSTTKRNEGEEDYDTVEQMKEKLIATGNWSERKGFSPDCDEKEILKFLRLASKLNRRGDCIDYCVRCGCSKKLVRRNKTSKDPNSHIWPEGVLKVMQRVHFRDLKEFILNLTDGKRMGAGGLTGKLLCEECECRDSNTEKMLRNLYFMLLSKEGSSKLVVKTEKNWLKKVLVKVMFNGIVINIQFPNGSPFDEVFINLWRYYRFGESSLDLRLFLLPSDAFCPISKLTFCLESVLRNPWFTSLVQRDGSVFLYTQCDLFHVVVPLNEHSRKVFDKHYDCFHSDSVSKSAIVLHRTGNIRSGFKKATIRTEGQNRPPIGIEYYDENTYHSFPMVLIKENAHRIPELLLKTIFEPRKDFKKKDEVAVSLLSGRKTSYPHQLPTTELTPPNSPDTSAVGSTSDDEIFDPKGLSEEEEILKAAIEISPLWSLPKKNEELQELVAELRMQIADEQKKRKVEARNRRAAETERDNLKEKHENFISDLCSMLGIEP